MGTLSDENARRVGINPAGLHEEDTVIVKSITVTLTDAQIKTASGASTPLTLIIPALLNGRIIIPVMVSVSTNIIEGYTNVGEHVKIQIKPPTGTSFATESSDFWYAVAGNLFTNNGVNAFVLYPQPIQLGNSDISLILFNQDVNGDDLDSFEDGNVNNTLTVTFYYTVI